MSKSPLFLPLTLLAITSASAVHAAKGYHLWYDENGQAVYSQFAPGEGRESRMVKGPPPPAEAPEVARQRLQQKLQQFDDNREDESLAREKTAQASGDAQQARQRCDAARRNLEVLQGRSRQLYQTPGGQVVRMSEEERQRKRAEMEEIIAADCKQ